MSGENQKQTIKAFQTGENAVAYSHSQSWTVSKKFYGIVNREIGSQVVANIYGVVSEVAAVAYVEFKL